MVPIPVSSRIIKAIHFSQSDGRLRIRFANGQERLFEGVSAQAVLDLVAAPSPGHHYIDHFRHRFARAA